jgi:uncharacterized protein YyaL (SSP411 family)
LPGRTNYNVWPSSSSHQDLFPKLIFFSTAVQIKYFYDAKTANALPSNRNPCGGFYSTVDSAPHTLLRLKDGMDTALPSTNSTSAANLFRLAALLGDAAYADLARETVSAFEVEMLQHPWFFPGLLAGVVGLRLGGETWAVVGGTEAAAVGEKVTKRARTAASGGLRNLIIVGGGTTSWLAGRNKLVGELVAGGKQGSFILEGTAYRPVEEKDLEEKTKSEEL